MTTITSVLSLPGSPYNNTGMVGIIITNNYTNFFQVKGVDLDKVTNVNWYPENPGSVLQRTTNLSLVDTTEAVFSVKILNNYLNANDRGGHISFRLIDGTTLTVPVITYGPISSTPLWTAPDQGLITG